MKKYILVLLFAFTFKVTLLFPQQPIDSLENLINTSQTKSGKEFFAAYSDVCYHYIFNNFQKSLTYSLQQAELAKTAKDRYWEADAWENLGILHYFHNKFDSSELFFKRAMPIWEELSNKMKVASTNVNVANIKKNTNHPDKAIELYLLALDFFEANNEEQRASETLANIGAVYNELGNNEMHDQYTLRALEIQRRLGYSVAQGISLINMNLSMTAQKKFGKAVEYGEEAIEVFRQMGEKYYIASSLIRTASSMLQTENNKKVVVYLNEAISVAKEIDNNHLVSEALRLRANYHLNKGEYNIAKQSVSEVLTIADTSANFGTLSLYDLMVTILINTGEKKEALEYFKKYIDLKNKLTQSEWSTKLTDMEVKYETEKKTIQIESLKNENRIHARLNYALGFIFFLSLTTIFFSVRSYRHERKVAEQKIVQLEKDKQLIATQAVLDGETMERSRLARDLHDGLGGMLSVVKLSLFNMKGNLILPEENMESFDRALTQLDQSIGELRNVAHNLMPESLIVKGVKAALSDFAESLPGVKFHFYGNESRFDEKLEVVVFRVAHELVSNALKHSGGGEVNIQLIQSATSISLGVNDNGRGFDMGKMDSFKGMGLRNIQHRVTSFGGRIDFNSSPGNGTEVNVEFSLG
jgi:two-component system, NarL family, sensor kinase